MPVCRFDPFGPLADHFRRKRLRNMLSLRKATSVNPFRHLVFPGEAARRKKVINFAPHADERPSATAEVTLHAEEAAFIDWLFAQAGLDAGAYRPQSLGRRLAACLRGLRAHSVVEARAILAQQPHLIAKAISSMLVGVTAFFRDADIFHTLQDEILPGLLRNRNGLYVWSAGCSDGAELYSVGMLFAEAGLLSGSYLLGTDCRADAIQRAREATYDALSCRYVPAALRSRYLTGPPDQVQVVAPLRAAVRWRVADVLQVQEPGIWDLILCRNTTMYFRPEAAAALWPRLEACLRPGGVLVLGKAERPVGVKRLASLGLGLYRRTRGAS